MLAKAGHELETYIVSNDDIRSAGDKVKVTWNLVRGNSSKSAEFAALVDRFRPDVVHIHNFFPLLNSAVHSIARKAGAAVVQTLHNYRLFCSAGTFVRNGEVCELCIHGTKLHGVANLCYRDSFLGSAAVAAFQHKAVGKGEIVDAVDYFIALTDFAKNKLVECGLPQEKIVVKPNFVRSIGAGRFEQKERQALYVGRITKEKGVHVLVEAWRKLPDIPLIVAGDGPARAELEQAAPVNVRFLGQRDREGVIELMRSSSVLIVPSLWYEGFPMTIAEAFSASLPVIASDIGSLGEIVRPGVNGELFEPGNVLELAEMVRNVVENLPHLSDLAGGAHADFERLYSEETNLRQLEAVYEMALRRSRSR